jgi:small subunit ribosomal protein S4
MIGPKERKERSLGVRLGLKPFRSLGPKAATVRKPYGPGQHGNSRRRPKALSDFGRQIKEKSKCKLVYGLDERGLRQLFERALKQTGSTSTHLMELLESRLDNVVFRLGFAPSRSVARQVIGHGHVNVNGRRVHSPGFSVKKGDEVSIRPESAAKGQFKELKESLQKYEAPAWLKVDAEKLSGKVLGLPEESSLPFEVNVLVESFSK